MKLRLLAAAASVALLSTPSLALAGDDDFAGWYLRGNVGYGTHSDIDIVGDINGDVESEGNGAFSLGTGYDFGNNWRLEADLATLWTDLGQVGNIPSTTADLRTTSLMLNALYDFSDFGKWEPYVGAGIGIVEGEASVETSNFLNGVNDVVNPACAPICNVDDEREIGLGWQLIAGLGYAISDNLTWDTQYRYLNVSDLDFNGNRLTTPIATTFEDVASHTLMTGFRYKFGAPVAPPPPPPPPSVVCWNGTVVYNAASCPVEPRGQRTGETVRSLCGQTLRQEVVYYDFDIDVSNEKGTKLNRVLDINDHCNVSGIAVVGHTDTSGSRAYNQNLSERRAADVMGELAAQGVNTSLISSEGKGETQNAVDTGDGVKEQLNRRTEVLVTLGSLGAIR